MKDRLIQVTCTLLIMTAAGCLSLSKDSQEIRTYQLSLDGWHSAGRPDRSSGPVLLVSPPQPEPGFETQHMVYVKRPYELEFYAVNQWADTPVRMLAPLMVEVLSQGGVWHSVIPLPNSIRGDYRLDTYGFSLQQEFFQEPSRVRVSIRTQLVDLKESEIVSTRAFEAVENAPSENAYGGVLAANRAVAALLDQVGVWLGQCVQHLSECGR